MDWTRRSHCGGSCWSSPRREALGDQLREQRAEEEARVARGARGARRPRHSCRRAPSAGPVPIVQPKPSSGLCWDQGPHPPCPSRLGSSRGSGGFAGSHLIPASLQCHEVSPENRRPPGLPWKCCAGSPPAGGRTLLSPGCLFSRQESQRFLRAPARAAGTGLTRHKGDLPPPRGGSFSSFPFHRWKTEGQDGPHLLRTPG